MIRKIQGRLTGLWYRLTSPPYRLLKGSLLFDPVYYLQENPDVAAIGMDPLAHYLTRGFAERRSPGPFFDRRYYLHQVPDLDETADNPLLHFHHEGRFLGLRPNLLVDPAYYASRTPEYDSTRLDPLSHFLRQAGKCRRDASLSPYFDPQFYCKKYPDAAPLAQDPAAAYRHFLLVGLREKRQPSVFFDTAWYLDRTPILHGQGLDPISHYHLFGIAEGKSPSPLFDPPYYARKCDNAGEKDLFANYLRLEHEVDRRPCPWFDPVFYRETYLPADSKDSSLGHYLQKGVFEQAYSNRDVAELDKKPLISVVVPVYNVPLAYLNTCIRSVLYQSYPHWELCLADDCSTDPEIRPLLREWANLDRRIKVAFLSENRGISAATNEAVALATGEYLAFLDNDDEFAPEALFSFARTISNLGSRLFYSDEDLIGADGTRFSIFRKPAFNRELLLCHNYVTHCVVAAKELFDAVGGCDSKMNGAQDHDLFLKLAEQAEEVVHIPEILYHWRASESSTSINHSQKEYADEAGRNSVVAALARVGIEGEVLPTELKFFYRARRILREDPGVALLVHWQRPMDDFRPWLDRFIANAGHPIRKMAVAVESPEGVETITRIGMETGIAACGCNVPEGSGPAAAYNAAAADLHQDFVALVDCFLEAPSDGWLAALLEYGREEDIGFVGGRIDYLSNIPEVTHIPDYGLDSPTYFSRFLANCSILMNGLHCPQEVRSITGEICLIPTELLRETGGFDVTDFPRLFFIQDLAFRLHLDGRRHIYTPYCSATLATPTHRDPRSLISEKSRFQERWRTLLNQGDPFYNLGLLVDRGLSADAFSAWLTGSHQPHPST